MIDWQENGDYRLMMKEAHAALHVGKFLLAAEIYLQLSQKLDDDMAKADILARMAHCYEKAARPKEAAYWYLHVAKKYVESNFGTQAVACLDLCCRLSGEYQSDVKLVVLQLKQQGFEHPHLEYFLTDEDRLYHILKNNQLFSNIHDHEVLTKIRQLTGICTLEDGEVLVHMADEAREMYYVIAGSLEASMTFDNRRDLLGHVHTGEFCGEITYFTGGRRTAELVAVGEVHLLVMPFANLAKLQLILPRLKGHMEQLYRERILLKQLALAPMFSILDALTWKFVAQHMSHIELHAGTSLFEYAEKSSDVYLVRAGHLNINVVINGEELPLKSVSRGEVIGEMAIVNHGRREMTVRAITRCSLMILKEKYYQDIFNNDLELQWFLSQRKRSFLREIKHLSEQVKHEKIDVNSVESSILNDIWRDR